MKMDLFDSSPRQQSKSTARAEGRSLPFSEDGEKGVLCSLFLSPRGVLDLCQIKLRPEAFYTPAHQILFNLVAELVDSNKPPRPVQSNLTRGGRWRRGFPLPRSSGCRFN